MNIHKYWDLIKEFEYMLLRKDKFYRHKLKRINGEYVLPEIKIMFEEFKSLEKVEKNAVEQAIKTEEVIIPELELF